MSTGMPVPNREKEMNRQDTVVGEHDCDQPQAEGGPGHPQNNLSSGTSQNAQLEKLAGTLQMLTELLIKAPSISNRQGRAIRQENEAEAQRRASSRLSRESELEYRTHRGYREPTRTPGVDSESEGPSRQDADGEERMEPEPMREIGGAMRNGECNQEVIDATEVVGDNWLGDAAIREAEKNDGNMDTAEVAMSIADKETSEEISATDNIVVNTVMMEVADTLPVMEAVPQIRG
ncbi:hypothetical protein DVH05_011473 [Phytophthora capsici]|nr:hypothetical protein DVH05_011473 [Phytophthora capsici]